MDWNEMLDRLDFQDKLTCDNEIQALMASELTAVQNRKLLLRFERNALSFQFEAHGAGTDVLEQSRPERAVDCDATPDCSVDERLEFIRELRWKSQHRYLLRAFVFSWLHFSG